MDVREIVEQWLREKGYDGLCAPTWDCACTVDALMPCDFDCIGSCQPGYRVPCPGPEECEVGGECEFHISVTKPPADAEGSAR